MEDKKKIIFIDFNFSLPPNGGADIDSYQVIRLLHQKGYDVLFVGVAEEGSSDRGNFDPAQLPFPSIRIPIAYNHWKVNIIADRLISLIKEQQPSLIFLQHGYHIKIPVSNQIVASFPDIPIISRTYAHEIFCLRSPTRYKEQKPCTLNIFETPDYCRKCSLNGLKRELLSNELTSWTKDYVQSKAFSRVFTKNYLTSIKKWEKVIVSNTDQQNELKKYDVDSIVIPGGIEERFITQENFTQNNPNQEKIILMTGRCDDPSKGMDTLLEAGKILLQKRNDFKILVTSFNLSLYNKWVIPLGWLPRKKLFDIYAQSDICVVPSEWAEPFGLIAIEAMAMGKAVIASRIGGLKEIIQDNENGILFEPKNSQELAEKIDMLLDDPQLRIALGNKAKETVIKNYTWETIVNKYYIPLIEDLLSRRNNTL